MIVEIDDKRYETPDEVANLLESVSRERDELKDFAIWMTASMNSSVIKEWTSQVVITLD